MQSIAKGTLVYLRTRPALWLIGFTFISAFPALSSGPNTAPPDLEPTRYEIAYWAAVAGACIGLAAAANLRWLLVRAPSRNRLLDTFFVIAIPTFLLTGLTATTTHVLTATPLILAALATALARIPAVLPVQVATLLTLTWLAPPRVAPPSWPFPIPQPDASSAALLTIAFLLAGRAMPEGQLQRERA